jgi:hypothetical protein
MARHKVRLPHETKVPSKTRFTQRRYERLGKDDHIVRWFKPSCIKSLDWQTYKTLPEYITVRETRIRVTQPGFRTKAIVVVTTLLDPQQTTKEDLPKGAIQTLEVLQPLIELQAAHGVAHRWRLYRDVLDAIATHRVADRPDPFQPPVKNRRWNHYGWLTRPRADVKRDMAKGVVKI